MEKTPIQRAFECVGSASKLAQKLGLSKGAVSQWRGNVPAEHCPSIERLTKGQVVCEELNDRTDWTYLRGTKKRKSKEKPM